MLKKFLKLVLREYLKVLSKLVLIINKPLIIAISGSLNKSFTKDAIEGILRNNGFSVRSAANNFNTDIGLSLAVLNLSSGYNSYKKWWPIIISAPGKLFQKNYPKILILELGVSDPGDMAFLLSIIKPKIGIITEITKRYLESFSGIDRLAKEYEALARGIEGNGLLIYNNDNLLAKEIAASIKIGKSSFGFETGADYLISVKSTDKINSEQIINIKNDSQESELVIKRPGQHHARSQAVALNVLNYINDQPPQAL